jgi:uncharacterized RDD family membrane protein YckC
MATCPSCHRDQDQSSAFCAHCGAVLDRPMTSTPLPPTAPAQGRVAQKTAPVAMAAHEVGDVGAYIVRRLLALGIDILLVGALIAIAARAWFDRATPNGAMTLAGFTQLAFFVAGALFVYLWLFEGIAGSTLGKLTFGLGVAGAGGGPAGLGRSFVRNLLLPVDLALIGFLLAAITPRRRRLGDLVAGTVVANSRIGAFAPAFGIAVLAAATYAVNLYAGGVSAAQHLARDATQLAPALVNGASPSATTTPPPPSPEPSPSPTSSGPPAS